MMLNTFTNGVGEDNTEPLNNFSLEGTSGDQSPTSNSSWDNIEVQSGYSRPCSAQVYLLQRLSPPWLPLPVTDYPQEEYFFPLTQSHNPSCHNLCSLPLLDTAPVKSLPLCSPYTQNWQLKIMIRFLFSRLTRSRYPRLFLHTTCFRPPTKSVVLCWTRFSFAVFLLYWEAQNWTKYSRNVLTSAVKSRITTSLSLLATVLLLQYSTVHRQPPFLQ